MTPWRKRFFETTRGRLVALLRQGQLTVDEMASALGVTDNAVRAQLATLERDGLVEQQGVRRGAGKPSYAYGLTAEFEPTLSRAYVPLLLQLLRELQHRMTEAELTDLLAEVGRRWAAELPPAGGSARDRAEQVAALFERLGGATEVDDSDGRVAVRGFGCPLGLAVHEQPRVCAAVEAMLMRVAGMEVQEQCDRGSATPSCRFVIGPRP